ncbi:MAG TPA: MarR family transcriptional regulator [Nocardioidaceae bacterium]|nr:MarR family transcriptional regulator [Nocardioidaceae bacterium]
MSTHHARLVGEVMQAVAEFQDGTDAVDEAAARTLSINRTDLRCLGLLSRHGPMPAGQLSAQAGLSTGATTAVVDRLVVMAYVRRVRDAQDRRRVTIELTPAATRRLNRIWGPIGQEALALLQERKEGELKAIRDFLAQGRKFQLDHAARIRRERPRGRSS